MDAFSYLSVLFSIILGLAITQILQGYRALLLARGQVLVSGRTLLWSGTLLLFAVQSWWASFGLAQHRNWTFLAFAALLLQTVLLYMMAAIVLPDVRPDEPADLRAHYRREITPFFLLLIGVLSVSMAKDVVLDGRLPVPENLAFHGAFAGLATVALLVRADWLHRLVAVAVPLLASAYIGLLFAQL